MKTIILTEGGRNIGFGHSTRCIALTQGIKKADPKTDIEFIVNGDNSIKDFLKKQNIKPVVLNWIEERKKVFSLVKKADLVIIDSYTAPRSFYSFVSNSKSHPKQRVIAIDDYDRINYPVDVVINPSIYGDKLSYASNARHEPIYLTGKDYIILRKEFWKVPQKVINAETKDVLITFGGGSRTELIKGLSNFFAADYPGFTLHIVTGSDQNLFIGSNCRPYYSLSALSTRNLMLKCDICISAGGQTLYELARIGVPAVGICFAENQRLNLEALCEKGFIEHIGWFNNRNLFDNLNASILKLASKEARLNKHKIGRSLVDGQGVKRLIKCILGA